MSATGKSSTVLALQRLPLSPTGERDVGRARRTLQVMDDLVGTVSGAPAELEVVVPLRWVDVDALGHVYHGTYLTLLDEARSRFLAAVGVRPPGDHVVARVEVDYLAPVGPEAAEVLVRHLVERVGTTSVTLRSVLRTSDGVERVRARVVVVLWDPAGSRPRPVEDVERVALLRAAGPAGTIEG